MNSDINYLTQEGFTKLQNQLQQLKTVKRKEIARQIADARAHGDLSENAEYEAAKEAQGFNEVRINELESQMSIARIIDVTNMPTDKIVIGTTVKLKDLSDGETITYTLVSSPEADADAGKISITSPIGKSLLGHKEGETVDIKIPAGSLRYKVIGISR